MQNDGNLVLYSGSAENGYWSSNTRVPSTPNPPVNKNELKPGEGLSVGDSVVSGNGEFRLVLQSDGNLVEYSSESSVPVWASNTYGRLSWCLVMQKDGNLVLYDVHGKGVWASDTAGHTGDMMIIEDDGAITIFPATNAVWSTRRK
jgi:hypothetical protein